ncbi:MULTISPECIES: hypothetical protein [unclassified Paraburkholderia]|uniref:hypothetical protein n=1 Tax=unclassified Paraburkholderia TaxID=2615204 RepID=UPI002AAF5A43|nr:MULTISPECIES: hypothetical protein [unclassified Paraburkholderia]
MERLTLSTGGFSRLHPVMSVYSQLQSNWKASPGSEASGTQAFLRGASACSSCQRLMNALTRPPLPA